LNTIRVKICGITRKEDLETVSAAGADAVGFVVGATASPRNLTLQTAEKLLRQVPPFVKSVLVTVPTSIDELEATCRKLNPDAVQIHGKNIRDSKVIRERLTRIPLIRAVKANSPEALEAAEAASNLFDAILLDSLSSDEYGGTGRLHDWKLSNRIKVAIHPTPLILAGGLTPENVAEAVRVVKPYAVDVSSGVELQPGIKDKRKVTKFIRNAKGVKL